MNCIHEGKTIPPITAITPTSEWIYEVTRVIHEMAKEGISMEGCQEPQDLMCSLGAMLKVPETEDDYWQAALDRLKP